MFTILFPMEDIYIFGCSHWFIPDFREVSHYLGNWNSLLYKSKSWGQRLDTVRCSFHDGSWGGKNSMYEVFYDLYFIDKELLWEIKWLSSGYLADTFRPKTQLRRFKSNFCLHFFQMYNFITIIKFLNQFWVLKVLLPTFMTF